MISFLRFFGDQNICQYDVSRTRGSYVYPVPRVLRFNSPVSSVLPFLKPFYAVPLSIGPKNKVGYMAAHSDQCHVFEMERFAEKRLLVRSVMGALILEILMAARLESLCYFLGTWRGNNLEGANDPGNIFRHVTNQRQQGYSQAQINLLISALSVLTQLQGCSGPMDAVTLQMDFSVVLLLT